MTTLLFGCGTTAYNIKKSAAEISGNTLLTGRFIFYIDDVLIENSKGVTVYFKEKDDKRLIMFQPDETGYVYTPVNEINITFQGLRIRNSMDTFISHTPKLRDKY